MVIETMRWPTQDTPNDDISGVDGYMLKRWFRWTPHHRS